MQPLQQRAGWGLDPTRPGDMAPAGTSSEPVPTRPGLAQASVRKDAFGKPARGRQAPRGAAGDMLTSSKSSSSSSLVRTFSDAADATAPALPGQNGFTSRGQLSPSPPPEGRPLSTPLHEESSPGTTSNRDFESKLLPQSNSIRHSCLEATGSSGGRPQNGSTLSDVYKPFTASAFS